MKFIKLDTGLPASLLGYKVASLHNFSPPHFSHLLFHWDKLFLQSRRQGTSVKFVISGQLGNLFQVYYTVQNHSEQYHISHSVKNCPFRMADENNAPSSLQISLRNKPPVRNTHVVAPYIMLEKSYIVELETTLLLIYIACNDEQKVV